MGKGNMKTQYRIKNKSTMQNREIGCAVPPDGRTDGVWPGGRKLLRTTGVPTRSTRDAPQTQKTAWLGSALPRRPPAVELRVSPFACLNNRTIAVDSAVHVKYPRKRNKLDPPP